MALLGERSSGPLVIGGFGAAAFVIVLALALPASAAILAVWLLVSVPVGVAVGHCVLGRDDPPRPADGQDGPAAGHPDHC